MRDHPGGRVNGAGEGGGDQQREAKGRATCIMGGDWPQEQRRAPTLLLQEGR